MFLILLRPTFAIQRSGHPALSRAEELLFLARHLEFGRQDTFWGDLTIPENRSG
jgi:hypothetical protein